MQKSSTQNRQVQRTKSWIFEALMQLMEKKHYEKISVSDICDKACIARPTFYRNFDDKDDVVFDYLRRSFSTELLDSGKDIKDDNHNSIALIFNYNYMIKHQKYLKKILAIADIENRIFRDMLKFPLSFIKQYKDKLSPEEYLICRYKLCYQITGSLRIFFDWFINNMPMPIENVVSMMNAMNIPKTIQYRNIPSIVVKIKNG